MPFQFFTIPTFAPGPATEELNSFLRSHRILHIDRQLAQRDTSPVWLLAVEYLDGGTPINPSSSQSRIKTLSKVDYREILDAPTFAIFARLREWRKLRAQSEGVPVYALFSNEQLAEIAKTRPGTTTQLVSIEGIGEAKSKKYGEDLLKLLAEESPVTEASVDTSSSSKLSPDNSLS